MAEDIFILKKWDEQVNIFISNLQIIRQKTNKKAVHDIRVAIKKIRSYLRLKQELTGKKWDDQFAGIKTLFKILGKQRDFEMSLSLLSKYNLRNNQSLPYFKKFLQINCKFAKQGSKHASLDFNTGQLQILTANMNASLSDIPNEIVRNKIRELCVAILKKVRKLSRDFEKNIHEIRKLLKDLYYWLIACPENPADDLLPLNSLEKILTDLGRWQDHFIFLHKLSLYRKEVAVKGNDEFDIINTCQEEVRKIQNKLSTKIKNNLKILLSK